MYIDMTDMDLRPEEIISLIEIKEESPEFYEKVQIKKPTESEIFVTFLKKDLTGIIFAQSTEGELLAIFFQRKGKFELGRSLDLNKLNEKEKNNCQNIYKSFAEHFKFRLKLLLI